MKIYLIRHAEAEGNIYRRCHGHYNSLLTPKGEIQAGLLTEKFNDIKLDKIYSSDLARTLLTAKPLATSKNLEIIKSKELREISMGDWEDIPWGELPFLYPEQYAFWEKEPWNCKLPNGETPVSVGERLFKELEKIGLENKDKSVAVFTHGAAIRAVLTKIAGLAPDKMPLVGWCDNTAVALLEYNGSFEIIYKNDNKHLPENLSTLTSQKWWKDEDKDASSFYNMWFKPVSVLEERETLLKFAKQTFISAYGSTEMLDEEAFIKQSLALSEKNPKAVVFGMIKKEISALVRLDVLNKSEANTGMVATFCIDEKYQGGGYAPQILGHATHVYRNMGKHKIRANVASGNIRAQKFYIKNGFLNSGECENAFGKHFVMIKNINTDNI